MITERLAEIKRFHDQTAVEGRAAARYGQLNPPGTLWASFKLQAWQLMSELLLEITRLDTVLAAYQSSLDGAEKDVEALRQESIWIRQKLNLPDLTPLFSGSSQTLAGTLHVLCSHAYGFETYIQAFRCNDKQGEIARLTVEVERLKAGSLTPQEFQTLCHNLHERGTPCTRAEFEHGCREFSDKLFGKEVYTGTPTISGKKCPVTGLPIECVDPKEYD